MFWRRQSHLLVITITSFPAFLKELENIRLKGYFVDNEENAFGVRCITASLPAYDGQPNYAFSVSAPINRMDDKTLKRYSEFVLATKKQLLREL